MWTDIEQAIEQCRGGGFQVESHRAVGGGCINEAFTIEGAGQRYFVKFNDASKAEMFSAEFDGLAAMAATDSVRVPNPIAYGTTGARAWIVMEHIDFGGGGTVLTT
ncbi:MAG: fructosamine kinase family protein, partial [Gammaproteobacteria bacterium]